MVSYDALRVAIPRPTVMEHKITDQMVIATASLVRLHRLSICPGFETLGQRRRPPTWHGWGRLG
jgi:hypothetical protein